MHEIVDIFNMPFKVMQCNFKDLLIIAVSLIGMFCRRTGTVTHLLHN